MALVPWKLKNPYVNAKYDAQRTFCFSGLSGTAGVRRIVWNDTSSLPIAVEILQSPNADIDLNHNTGLVVWDGAYVLAKYLAEHVPLTGVELVLFPSLSTRTPDAGTDDVC